MVKIYTSKLSTLPSEKAICSFRKSLDSHKIVAALISFLMTSMSRILNQILSGHFFEISSTGCSYVKRLLVSHFFSVEYVVSNCKCECSFVTGIFGLIDCFLSKKNIDVLFVAIA